MKKAIEGLYTLAKSRRDDLQAKPTKTLPESAELAALSDALEDFEGLKDFDGWEPTELFRIAALAKQVREAQRAYFANRTQGNLIRSKELEAALDALLKMRFDQVSRSVPVLRKTVHQVQVEGLMSRLGMKIRKRPATTVGESPSREETAKLAETLEVCLGDVMVALGYSFEWIRRESIEGLDPFLLLSAVLELQKAGTMALSVFGFPDAWSRSLLDELALIDGGDPFNPFKAVDRIKSEIDRIHSNGKAVTE